MTSRGANRSKSYDVTAHNRNNTRTLKRTESRVGKLKRQMSQGASNFLGLTDNENEEKNIWLQRRAAFHGNTLFLGKGVSKKCKQKLAECEEGITTPIHIRDPLHIPGTPRYRDDVDFGRQVSQSSAVTRSSLGTRRRAGYKKDSVAKLALDGLSQVLMPVGFGMRTSSRMRSRIASNQSRMLHPPSISEQPEDEAAAFLLAAAAPAVIQEESDLDDEVFFDNKSHSTSAHDLRRFGVGLQSAGAGGAGEMIRRPVAQGWGREIAKPVLPDTPGIDKDQVDFFPARVVQTVKEHMLERPVERRRLGEGLIGRIFRRNVKHHEVGMSVKEQLDEFHDHRPYFTYWVTFVQLVILIVTLSVYGFAPWGFGKQTIQEEVLITALYPKQIGFQEPENFWGGPRQADLIHLGAKYAPCMRKDKNIDDLHEKIKINERGTACCIYHDKSGCFQSRKDNCHPLRAEWYTYSPSRGDDRSNGTVCGQEPKYCANPRNSNKDVYPDDITEWPICKENMEQADAPHMKCNVLSRPCCIGVKGECQILTEEHCKAKRGHFHKNATLCSQVNCLEKICGLIKFHKQELPDQCYRAFLSLFLHAGIIHFLLTALFQFLVMRDMEKLAGAARIGFIYIGSGVAGNMASAIFVPYHVEVGPAGSIFGILATLVVEVIHSWKLVVSPKIALFKLLAVILFLFIMGLLPWIDNYAHITGFVVGLFLSFIVLPYVTFGSKDKLRKRIMCIGSIVVVIAIYIGLYLGFYLGDVTKCEGCKYLNCVPFVPDFCEDLGVQIDVTETKFEWEVGEA